MLERTEKLFNKNKSTITSINQMFNSDTKLYVVEAMVVEQLLKGESNVAVIAEYLKVSATVLLSHLNRVIFRVDGDVISLKPIKK